MNTTLAQRELTYEEERNKPMPSTNHGIVQANLIVEFSRDPRYRVLSELTLEMSERPLTPDLSIYPRSAVSFDAVNDIVRQPEPPVLAVEISSPTQVLQEVWDKIAAYFAFGVPSCWFVVVPSRLIHIVTADGREERVTSGIATDPVTGLTADTTAVFA